MQIVDRDDQYVLNHCTKYLARDSSDPRHDFGQYSAGDRRAAMCEAWRFPIIDTHWDGSSAETSYGFNNVTFVYDARGGAAPGGAQARGRAGGRAAHRCALRPRRPRARR